MFINCGSRYTEGFKIGRLASYRRWVFSCSGDKSGVTTDSLYAWLKRCGELNPQPMRRVVSLTEVTSPNVEQGRGKKAYDLLNKGHKVDYQ